MKNSNYETIIKNLRLSFHQPVKIKNKDGDYLIFSPFKDENGNYRNSPWCSSSLKQAKRYTMAGASFSQKDLEEESQHWKLLEPIYFPPEESVKQGDMVMIMSNAESECKRLDYYWDNRKAKMIGGIFQIKSVFGRYVGIWNESESDCMFPKTCVCYSYQQKSVQQKSVKVVKTITMNWKTIPPKKIKINGYKYKRVEKGE